MCFSGCYNDSILLIKKTRYAYRHLAFSVFISIKLPFSWLSTCIKENTLISLKCTFANSDYSVIRFKSLIGYNYIQIQISKSVPADCIY